MRKLVIIVVLFWNTSLFSGWTDTAPKHIFMFDLSYRTDTVRHIFDNEGNLVNLSPDIAFYDSNGRWQGTLRVPAVNQETIGLYQIMYGVTDNLTLAVVIPHIITTWTKLNLQWIPGEFDPALGRSMTFEDFCQYIESMGQPCPHDWRGKDNQLGDVIVGFRYRFFQKRNFKLAFMGFVSTRTGAPGDPEELGAVGTTGYEYGSNGDLGFYLIGEKDFKKIVVNGEVFYEPFYTRRWKAPEGKLNPLLLNNASYVGKYYKIKPGDFYGFALGADLTIVKGSDNPTWLTRDNPEMQKSLPSLWIFSISYKRTWGLPDKFYSHSQVFDREMELSHYWKLKNTLQIATTVSLFRIGIPLDFYGTYSDQELLGGRGYMPLKEWGVGVHLYYSLDIWPL